MMTSASGIDLESEKLAEALESVLPQVFELFIPHIELMIGRKVSARPTRLDFAQLVPKLKRLLPILTELESLKAAPITAESQARQYQLMNKYIRLTMTGIPRHMDPLEYVVAKAREMCDPPRGIRLPPGLDYQSKHDGLLEFARDVSASSHEAAREFIAAATTERQLVAQFQRAYGNIMLPRDLKMPPLRITSRSAERVKLAMRDVASDWEALVNLVYGIQRIGQGRALTWSATRQVALRDKVSALRNDARLVSLGKDEWVTVRNSLDHGWAYYAPANRSIEFPDRHSHVSWPLHEAVHNGRDMFLANAAMMHLPNLAGVQPLIRMEPWVKVMSAATRQTVSTT